MSMRAVDLTSWSAPRLHALGATETWKRSIDLKAGVDFTPGWKRLKFITPGNTIWQVSILFRGKLDHPVLLQDIRSSESRFVRFIFVSPDISNIRIELYLVGAAIDRFSATARPISLPEYLYKTLPHSLRSPVEIVRYYYDPPFPCTISRAYPRPDDMPAIAVLMPLSNPNPRFLREAIDSVRFQTYRNWTLRIAGSGLLDGDTANYLTNLPREDPRIFVALADSPARLSDVLSAAFGPGVLPYVAYVTALNQHDVLAARSLEMCAALLSSNPAIEIVYTDHDVIDHDGRRRDPTFKRDFSLDLLYSYDYMCCQIVYRARNFRKVGGWRDPFSHARDYDLTLRVLECIEARQVSHIPAVLYHRRQESGPDSTGSRTASAECFRSALADHLARRGISAEVLLTSAVCCPVKQDVGIPEPTVSITIPTRDQPANGSIQGRIDAIGWYHEFDFGNGLVARPRSLDLENHRRIWAFIRSRLDDIDFAGKAVLDIGCWDGYWSYYAERRGAARVLATDDADQNWGGDSGLQLAKELLHSKIETNTNLPVYRLAELETKFDIILCLGVYYHLIDPFYAFAQIRHCCHEHTIVVFEGDVRSSLPPETGTHRTAGYNFAASSHSRFWPAPDTLAGLLQAAYFTVASEAYLMPWTVESEAYLIPWTAESEAYLLPWSLQAPSSRKTNDRSHIENRILLICRAYQGENRCFWYRPPFGLDQYDTRWGGSRT